MGIEERYAIIYDMDETECATVIAICQDALNASSRSAAAAAATAKVTRSNNTANGSAAGTGKRSPKKSAAATPSPGAMR
jgi:hypothetical protein